MRLTKNELFLGLSMMAGTLIAAAVSYYLQEIFNIDTDISYSTLVLLIFIFVGEYFYAVERKRGLWEITSYSKKDRIVFLSWLFTLTFILGCFSLISPSLNLIYRLFFLVIFLIGAPHFLIVFSSLEIRNELKEKFKFRKQEQQS